MSKAREQSTFGQFQLTRSKLEHPTPLRLLKTSDMAAMLRAGATLEEVAKAVDRKPATIQGRLSAAGWSTTGHPRSKK